MGIDKDSPIVKHKMTLGGAQAPRELPERLRTRPLGNPFRITTRWKLHRSTIHRFGHRKQIMMLLFGHPACAGCESAQSDGRSSLR